MLLFIISIYSKAICDVYAGDKNLILVKGNHDIILGPIADKRNLKVVNYYKTKEIMFLHGDKILKESLNSKILIIGHEHPALNLREGPRKELYKCFLVGKFNNKKLLDSVEEKKKLWETELKPLLKELPKFNEVKNVNF